MALQSNIETTIAYKAETTFGEAPTATGAKYLRRVSTSLALNKDGFTSNEVRSDQQIADMRHGGRSARGGIEGELSTETYDDFLEALIRGTWAAGASTSPSDFATGVTIADSGATGSTLTFAGAGNLMAVGFRIGDVVRATGLTDSANNDRNLRITALTATEMTVFPQITAAGQQAAGWTVAVAGRKVTNGLVKRSFALRQSMSDAGVFELFTGCRIGGATINVQPSGMATINFEIMGKDGTVDGSAYFTSPTAEGVTGVISGIDGGLRLDGAERAVLTGLQMNYTNNLSMTPVIGSRVVPEIFYGRQVVTGSVSAYFDSIDLYEAFLLEQEVDLVAQLNGAGTEPNDFLCFNMQRVKLNAAQKTIGPDGGVVGQFPFQALLKGGGTGTAYDTTTLTIQRSNA